MDSQLASDDSAIEELRHCAVLLSEKLQSDNYEEASVLINCLTESRDKHVFQSVGTLTRALHDAIVNFNVDGGKKPSSEGTDEGGDELNDASSRLEYVIKLTQNAADKTMDMVEACAPISLELGQEALSLKGEWARLRNREMSPDEFRELYKRLDIFFEQLDVSTNTLNENLQNIILEQGFQDLTGQVLKKVINLVTEVEANLVSLVRIAGQVENVVGIEAGKKPDKSKETGQDISGEGPQHKASQRNDVVTSQDDVDDLLSSLGF
ncbi:MAG: chemotaxis protein CheZ [Cellvibrionaceae bacterium]|jgi:chemotaxis protein CheZ